MLQAISKVFRKSNQLKPSPERMLSRSIMSNDLEGVKKAIKLGADLNAIIELPKDRALHLALDYADDEILGLLLAEGARTDLAVHRYPCFEVPLSKYAELAGRLDLAAKFRALEVAKSSPVKPPNGPIS